VTGKFGSKNPTPFTFQGLKLSLKGVFWEFLLNAGEDALKKEGEFWTTA
jgi:hypothetical protein